MATKGTPSVSECPLCFNRYRNPKMLLCGHTFCLDPCLRELLQSSSPSSCPLCRICIQLPQSGKVDDLPTNFALQSMLEERTTDIDESSVVHKRKEIGPIKQNKCSTHEEDFMFYCTVCSELLCQKCLEGGHNKEHDALQVLEVVNRYCGRLGPVEEGLVKLIKKLDDVCLVLEDAKKRYERECAEIKKTVAGAGKSAIEEIRKRMTELNLELDKTEKNERMYHDDLAAKADALSVSCESTYGIRDKRKLGLAQMNFKKMSAIGSETKKTPSIVYTSSSDSEDEALKYLISFTASKLTDLHCNVSHCRSYHTFSLLSPNSIVFLMTTRDTQHEILNVLYRTGQSETELKSVKIEGEISNVSSLRLNRLTKFLLLKNNRTPLQAVFNENDKNCDVTSSVTLENALLYQINALTWDEHGENCYALLNDCQTIKSFTFHPERREMFHVRLNEKVNCSNSKGFHVSQFGMAICDEKRKIVMYLTSLRLNRLKQPIRPNPVELFISPRFIRAPYPLKRWSDSSPVCVTFLQSIEKWYVLWNSSYSESSCLYQYSNHFREEHVLLQVSCNIISFSFLDEKYISTDALTRTGRDRYSPSTVCVSVYEIKRFKSQFPSLEKYRTIFPGFFL